MENKFYQKKEEAESQAEAAKSTAQAELDIQIAKFKLAQIEHEQRAEAEFRAEIGLTLLENDANILREKLVKARLELAFCVEMDKSNYMIGEAKLRVQNTRVMYDGIRKKIFKICLKHGVKSEHSTRS